jgi:hypothetical protein
MEDDGRPATAADGVHVNDATALIREKHVGERVADLRTDPAVVDQVLSPL